MGRQREMDDLRAALDDTLSGHGHLIMLVGEPGIGKTRTAQELAVAAESQGVHVFWGRCYEEEGVPPYWPWVQLIRSYVQQIDLEQLGSEMGPGAVHIAEIVSEVGEKLPGLESPPTLDPEHARFRLFDSITTFLKNAAQARPLMLVLEDLHWADKPALSLLQFLTREMGGSRLLVVGTYRDVEMSRQHPLFDTLAQLSREPVFRRELLGGLSQEDTGQFISATAGLNPPQMLVESIYAHTEGNPFFMTEVIHLLSERGELLGEETGRTESIGVPESVREVIGQRLNRLSDRCNRTLTTASVVGREFSLGQLGRLLDDLSEEELLEALEEASAARIIEELSRAPESYQFSHALIQETLVSDLSVARRIRLHARIGEALEEMHAAEIEAHASELAHHFARAEPVLGTDKLVRYSRIAGERALSTYAWEEAGVHFTRALNAERVALSGTEPAKDAETADLLFGLGRAQAGAFPLYRVREAITTLGRAFNYYADVLDVDRALAVVHYPIIGLGVGRRSGRAQMLERAMTLIHPDSHEEGRLLSDYGAALGLHEGDYSGAQAALNRAITIARREDDAALEMRSLCHAARVDRLQGRIKEALDKSLRALELAPQANDLASEADAHFQAGGHSLLLGDSDSARYHASAIWVPAEKLGDRFSTLNALLLNIRHSMLVGEWAVAREFSDRALTTASLDAR
ncbi:MAG: AAA family ATPase, partial [Dehalococcoidia bacterium]